MGQIRSLGENQIMTTAGFIIMALSVGGTTCLLSWCIYRVLNEPESSAHVHGVEFDTPDIQKKDAEK